MDEIIVPAMDSPPPLPPRPSASQASSGVLRRTSKLIEFTVAALGGGATDSALQPLDDGVSLCLKHGSGGGGGGGILFFCSFRKCLKCDHLPQCHHSGQTGLQLKATLATASTVGGSVVIYVNLRSVFFFVGLN